jgi:CYTH domain-containing protein
MGTEIERKYRVVGDAWRQAEFVHFCQGYLNRYKERTVRVRLKGEEGWLTIKGLTVGATKPDFEYPIPADDARSMLSMCDGPLIEKNRYDIVVNGLKWEVDEFLGDNAGLVVAEVELTSEDEDVQKPDWVGDEVTSDPRYFNSNLSVCPYSTWDDQAAS